MVCSGDRITLRRRPVCSERDPFAQKVSAQNQEKTRFLRRRPVGAEGDRSPKKETGLFRTRPVCSEGDKIK